MAVFLTSVGDEAAAISQVAGSVSRQRLVDQSGDLELDALPHWKPVVAFMDNNYSSTSGSRQI